LAFAEHGWKDTTWTQPALDLGLVALVAPFFRYLLGTTQLVDSGGSTSQSACCTRRSTLLAR
jgi:hypothetical protein